MTKTANALTLAFALGLAGLLAHAAFAALPTPVNGQITDAIAAVDNNKDGSVDAHEWRAAGDRAFAAIDSNNDGTISREEFAKFRQTILSAMDTDHDGKVTAAEAAAYQQLPWTLARSR